MKRTRKVFLDFKTEYNELLKRQKSEYRYKKIEILKNARNGRAFWNTLFYIKKKHRVNAINEINWEKWQHFLKEDASNKCKSEKKP